MFKLSMKIILFISVILFVNNFQYVLSESYCEIQRNYCRQYKHIGCETNVFEYNKKWSNFTLGSMTPELKGFILTKFNTLKNDVALGRINELPTASKLNIIKWSNEFQTLSEREVRLVAFEEDTCNLIDEFEDVYPMHHKVINKNLTPHELFGEVFEIFRSETNGKNSNWVAEHIAGVERIGCSFSSYEENNENIQYLNCGFNAGTSYRLGVPCSHCDNGKQCDIIYEGLCS